jgi:molybdate/tungstate transport system substrate-binding protein
MKRLAISLLAMLMVVMSVGLAHAETTLKVTLPKSYEAVFTELAKNFKEKEGINIKMQSTCSGKAAKEVRDYGMFIDLVISADYSVINKQLIDNKFADWNLLFAKNEMVVGYTNRSKGAGSINKSNWYKTLMQGNTKLGISAADDEPCGYRAMMVLELAERLYNVAGLKDKVLENTLYEKKSDMYVVQDLLDGKVDYIITYKSYAIEKGFKYLALPKEINLFSARYLDDIKDIKVETNIDMGMKNISATCIYYSLTIPSTVQHRAEAVKLAAYIKSNEAAKIMEKHGFFVVCNPLVTGSASKLDKPLRDGTIHAVELR